MDKYEHAITHMEMCKKCTNLHLTDHYYDLAIEAIREKQIRERTSQNPEVLTEEQLRDKANKCEHVYAAHVDGTDVFRGQKYVACAVDFVAGWGLAHLEIQAIYGRRLSLAESDYSKTWLAYSQKPEVQND